MTRNMKTAAASAVLTALLATAALAQDDGAKEPEMKRNDGNMSGEMNADGMAGMQNMMTMMQKMGPMMEKCMAMMEERPKPSKDSPPTEDKG